MIQLPSELGMISIERDPLSRLASFSSPFYSTSDHHYDSVGNLLDYRSIDSQGSKEWHFSYDDLNQLQSDNDFTYSFDSLHNRIKKDEKEFSYNDLCQLTSADRQYDPNGNLLSAGDCLFIYDSQDRLITVKKKDEEFHYTYDSFHRRLSKTIWKEGKKKETLFYLWDGQDEIGSANEDLVLQEIRILGEGKGAEIGAAVFFELKGKLYVPIHNHQGSLAAIVDCKAKKTIEVCHYTPFGEELTPQFLSPWRFFQ